MFLPLFTGAGYALKGWRLLGKPRVRRFVIVPFLINLLIFGFTFRFGFGWLDAQIESWLPTWLEWLRYILWPLLLILGLGILFTCFTLVANLIGAPFNSRLAEIVALRLDNSPQLDQAQSRPLLLDTLDALRSEVGKLGYFAIRALPLLILFLIPGLNVIAPLAWFLFGAWMLSKEYLDYPLGNAGMNFSSQRNLLRQKKRITFGFGLAVLIMTLIPIVNFFAMPAAVAGATLLWHDQFKNPSLK